MKLKNLVLVATSVLALSCGDDKEKKKSSTNSSNDGEKPLIGKDLGLATMSIVNSNEEKHLKVRDFVPITVKFENQSESSKWSLYYTKSMHELKGSQPIVEDISTSVTEVNWDVTMIESGDYYLYGVLQEGDVKSIFHSETKFSVTSDASSGNVAPSVTINFPAGDKAYAPSEEVAISFTVVDENQDDEITAKVEYTDDGTNWILIEDKIPADKGQTSWTIPPDAKKSANYRIRVTADDGIAKTETLNDKVFGVTDTPVTFATDLRPLFTTHCDSCHSGALREGNYDSTNLAQTRVAQDYVLSSTREKRAPGVGAMPPSGTLPITVRDAIQFWMWNGTQ